MFGDVYSNRGFAGETAGSSPGDTQSPVRTRVLLVADEGGQPEGEPSQARSTASTRFGFVHAAEGGSVPARPGSGADPGSPAGGGVEGDASSLSEALLASRDPSRMDGGDDDGLASGASASGGGDEARGHPEIRVASIGGGGGGVNAGGGSIPGDASDPGTAVRRGDGVEAAFPRIGSGLFRDPVSLSLANARGGRARYAFDPWTKLPVFVEAEETTPLDAETPRRRRRFRLRWCWHVASPSWWVAFFYLLGSVGFAAGGLASCLNAVVSVHRRYFELEVVPYASGGAAFLVATTLLVYTSWTARYGEPGRAERKRVAKKHAFLSRHYSRVSVVSDTSSSFTRRLLSSFSFFCDRRVGHVAVTRDGRPPNFASDSADASGASSPSRFGVNRTETSLPIRVEARSLPPSFWTLRAAVGEFGVVGDSVTQPLMDDDMNEVLGLSDAMEEARRLWLANDSWTRRRRALELVSSGLILLGVLLYKVMVFTMFFRCVFPDWISWTERKELFLYVVPTIAGSLFFVAGSYVLWCAVNRSWSPPFLPKNTPTWIAWLSVVGSVLYLLGSLPPVMPRRVKAFLAFGHGGPSDDGEENVVARSLTPEWPFLFAGFFLGSLVFLAQSALMIHEIAESRDSRDER